MNTKTRILVTAVSMLLPALVAAAAPEGVVNVQLSLSNGKLTASWDKAEADNIDHYRIYYSRESILGNDGFYDGVVDTEDSKGLFTFVTLPPYETLYVAVMAVDTDGLESEFFSAETSINLPPVDQRGAVEPEPVQNTPVEVVETTSDEKLSLLDVEVKSPTSLVLHLSHNPLLKPEDVMKVARVKKANGSPLEVKNVTASGSDLVIETANQESGVVYEITLSEPLMGEGELALDTVERSSFFTGHQAGVAPTVVQPVVPDAATIQVSPDLSGFQLKTSKLANGTYAISGTWNQDPALQKVTYFVVRQSFDGGKTFSQPNLVPANISSLNIQGVPAGQFGLGVQTMNQYGFLSTGIFVNTKLAGVTSGVKTVPPVGTVTPVQPLPSQGPLTSSGPGAIMLAITAFGGALGWLKTRKAF